MRQKLLKTMRTLLVAVLLGVGAGNAWGETTTVGTDNTTGWWSVFSDYYTIGQNHTLTVSFKNYSSKAENWYNYIGVLTTDADRDATGYSEYAVVRADCYAWQGDLNTNNNTTWFTSNTNNFDWDTFKDDMDGASVVMTVKRQGAKVTMRFDVTTAAEIPATYYHEFVINCGDGTQNIRAFLTTQNGHLTDITSSDLDNEALNYTSTYTVPDGWAIKNTFIGTLNNDGTSVAPETFKDVTTLPSAWDKGEVNSIGVVWKDRVATAAINASQSGTPTYVGGNTMRAYLRTGGDGTSIKYASYNLPSVVSKGKLFFATDVFADGDNTTTGPVYIRLVDSDGNPVLTLRPYQYDGNQRAYGYIVGNGELTSLGGNTVWRTYQGYGIKDLVVDLETGNVDLKLDLINRQKFNNTTDWYHVILPFTIPVGTGKDIAKIQIGKGSISKNDLYMYMDNIQLFSMEQQYAYTINYTSGGSTIKTVSGTAFEGDVINAESSIEVDDVTYVPTQEAATSLTITTTAANNVLNVPVVGSVPYTITYKLGDEAIDSENGNAETGTQVTATNTESFWKNEVKYYVTSATTFDVTASGNDFVVSLRLAATDAVATVNAVCGGTTHKTFTATGIEGEEATVYYSIVVKSDVDNKFYTVTTSDYSKALTYGASVDVTYTLDETIVGFTEIGTGTNSAQSGGGNSAWNSKFAEATVDAGAYRAEIMVISKAGSGSNHRQEGAFVADVKVASLSGNINGLRTLDFIVPTNETNIYVRGLGTSNYADNLDYVIIRKTADLPSTENIVVTSAGYATYVSDYNLDFSSATTKAYKVAVGSKGVATLTEVEKVPAKTPVLLHCAGGNGEGEAITITTDAVDAVTGNDLVAGTGAAVATTVDDYTNMILNNVSGKIGFYFANDQMVATNRAYLHIATSLAPDAVSGSARMSIVFDDSPTGIETISGDSAQDNGCINLGGQRVSQPTKGLYIVNGKKVLVK